MQQAQPSSPSVLTFYDLTLRLFFLPVATRIRAFRRKGALWLALSASVDFVLIFWARYEFRFYGHLALSHDHYDVMSAHASAETNKPKLIENKEIIATT